jgi:hypothetical protein
MAPRHPRPRRCPASSPYDTPRRTAGRRGWPGGCPTRTRGPCAPTATAAPRGTGRRPSACSPETRGWRSRRSPGRSGPARGRWVGPGRSPARPRIPPAKPPPTHEHRERQPLPVACIRPPLSCCGTTCGRAAGRGPARPPIRPAPTPVKSGASHQLRPAFPHPELRPGIRPPPGIVTRGSAYGPRLQSGRVWGNTLHGVGVLPTRGSGAAALWPPGGPPYDQQRAGGTGRPVPSAPVAHPTGPVPRST